jgi:hypothetical protein
VGVSGEDVLSPIMSTWLNFLTAFFSRRITASEDRTMILTTTLPASHEKYSTVVVIEANSVLPSHKNAPVASHGHSRWHPQAIFAF